MAKFVMVGVDDYIRKLEKLGGQNALGTIKYAVYPGAAVVADAVRAEIVANHSITGELAKSLSLSKMRSDSGFVNTKLSFAGYDRNGVPNAIKAAVLESGNSRGVKGTHFLSKTLRRVRSSAEQAMADALDQKINQIMEG